MSREKVSSDRLNSSHTDFGVGCDTPGTREELVFCSVKLQGLREKFSRFTPILSIKSLQALCTFGFCF
jgi:hypothetical protein